ncbi:MAG: GNAT family N-acetyltransferase [Candidatus Cybelea sp.]
MATIETARLLLRGWQDEDVEPWIAMNADPRVSEFLGRSYSRELSLSQASAMRERLGERGYGWWVVQARGGPSFVGVICLQEVPFEAPFTPAYEVGWRLRADCWGNGYATEGARGALGFAFDSLHWNEVVAFTTASNVRSAAVMQRLGMTHDPRDDFEHPRLEPGHPLRPHVLYRIAVGVAAHGC